MRITLGQRWALRKGQISGVLVIETFPPVTAALESRLPVLTCVKASSGSMYFFLMHLVDILVG